VLISTLFLGEEEEKRRNDEYRTNEASNIIHKIGFSIDNTSDYDNVFIGSNIDFKRIIILWKFLVYDKNRIK
jgi:hypothetical protein